MKLENISAAKPTRATSGRPGSLLTDRDWQTQFEIMKLYITPYPPSVNKLAGKGTRKIDRRNEFGDYRLATNWQEYASYINDVLKAIRSGKHDYCYYRYQLEDLLKFHHDDLRTEFHDWYWEVWLEN